MFEFITTDVGLLPSHWNMGSIGDFCNVTKLAGYEYTKYFQYVEDGEVIALRALNVREGVLDLSNIKRIYRHISDLLPRSKLHKYDLLFTYVGANIGQFALVPADDMFHLAPNICRIRAGSMVDPYFLYCYFRTTFFKDNLPNYSVGSSQPTLPMGNIRKIPIPVPPIAEQKAIAEVLSSLDDKIDLLHRNNKTLEGLAETLFRQWFIEEGIEATVGQEFNVVMGQSPPGNTYNDNNDGIPFYQGRTDFTYRFPAERIYCSKPTRLAQKYDTLLSVRAPVGDLNIANTLCSIGRGVASIAHKNPNIHYSYTYNVFKVLRELFDVHEDSGTIFGSINKDDVLNMVCIELNHSKVELYNTQIAPLEDKIYSNCMQILNLERLRDTLLPKLMNGTIKVNEFVIA